MQRLVEHRGFTEADARARIANQASRDERLAKATWVIDNSGDMDDLEVATMVVWEELVAKRDELAREAEVSAESRLTVAATITSTPPTSPDRAEPLVVEGGADDRRQDRLERGDDDRPRRRHPGETGREAQVGEPRRATTASPARSSHSDDPGHDGRTSTSSTSTAGRQADGVRRDGAEAVEQAPAQQVVAGVRDPGGEAPADRRHRHREVRPAAQADEGGARAA